jgi:hypothetical protein
MSTDNPSDGPDPGETFAGCPQGVAGNGCPDNAAHGVRLLNRSPRVVSQFRPTMVPDGCGSDGDCDGDVDLVDFSRIDGCLIGPCKDATGCCVGFDSDDDGDVDWADRGAFQLAAGRTGASQ